MKPLTGVAGAIALSLSMAVVGRAQAPETPCTAVKNPQLVCGQQGPEDLVALPDAQWVVASAFAGTGGINVIRVSDHKSIRAYPSATARRHFDAKVYAACPGPPDARPEASFTTHGLWIRPGRGRTHTLFVVGHGTRESVEVFEVDTGGDVPVLTWIGCVVAPDPIGLNSVRGLPDGGFIATNYLARGVSEQTRQKMLDGDKNGELWEWHTKSGWQKVPGGAASGANGIEISDDGRWFYVAAWGSQSFFRLSRGKGAPVRDEIPLGFRVDNLRWARDGSLLAAGQGTTSSDVVKINPKTMAVTRLIHRTDDAAFSGGTVAVEVGKDLWVGSWKGDRIAILPEP